VITHPARKWARAQFRDGSLEWQCGSKPGTDSVSEFKTDGYTRRTEISKTRPDDFIKELRHIEKALKGDASKSPISLERGLDTMMVVAAAHLSASTQKTVSIDWTKGYVPSALSA
jgi:predicted dehydrogenase